MKQKIKSIFKSSHSKNGAYSVGMIAIVIGIVIFINLIVGQLPENIRHIDISDNNLYSISKTSKDFLKKLDKKVKLTVLAEEDSTDKRISTFVKKYASLSKNVSVEWTDPVLHPSALKKYNAEANSIVVSCKDTDKTDTISFSEIITYDQSAYYQTGQQQEKDFDAEGQLTSSISSVTTQVTKKVYRTSGHGEDPYSDSVTELMEKNGLQDEEVNLLMKKAVPEDCDLLLMNGPTSDISKEEKTILTKYIQEGGKVMLLLGDAKKDTPVLNAFLKEYGLESQSGYIADTERCYQGNYYSIFPVLSGSDALMNGIENQMVLMANVRGFNQTDPARDTISVNPLLTTSENGYAITEKDQKQGSYVVGAVVTETVKNESKDSKDKDESKDSEEEQGVLTVYGSNSIISSDITEQFSTLDNLMLFTNSVTSNFSDIENISIKAKSLAITYNTPTNTGILSMFIIFVLPALALIGGFVFWLKRRKA